MTRREKTAALVAAVLTIVVTLYSAWKLVGTGVLSWHAAQPDFYSMALETAAVWLILFLLFFLCPKQPDGLVLDGGSLRGVLLAPCDFSARGLCRSVHHVPDSGWKVV